MAIFLWGSRSCSFRVELQEFCMCFTQTQGYLFEHRVKMNTLFKRIFYFHITGDDCQRVPFGTWTLDPAPFISHACKTPPAFGGMKKCCSWEGEHSCVSGCALPGCFSMNNWAEECKWSLCRQPQAETQPFSPSGPTDVRHNVGTGCCISCIAKASPIYIYICIPFFLFSAARSTLFLICLFVFSTFTIWEKNHSRPEAWPVFLHVLQALTTAACMKEKLSRVGCQNVGETYQDLIRVMVLMSLSFSEERTAELQ